MGRRRRRSGGSFFLLARLVLGIIILALAYVVPPVILLSWMIVEFRASSLGRVRIGEPAELSASIAETQSRIEETRQSGLADGLQLRQDSMFDARSIEGRDLNLVIGADQEMLDDLQDRLGRVMALRVQRDAMRVAAAIWIAAFLFLWIRSPQGDLMWFSALASVAAIVIAGGTYLLRKGSHESS